MSEPSTEPSTTELAARLAALESANATLRTQLTQTTAQAPRRHGRTFAATALIVLGALLAPAALVAGWARTTLTDTSAFVSTYAPLIDDPRVQAFVTDQVSAAIDSSLDIDGLVAQAFDGLSGSVQRPAAQVALQALAGPAADGLRSAISAAAARIVGSDAFAATWRTSLQLSHAQLTGALAGHPDSALVITGDGLGLRLDPLIASVKDALVAQGFTLAARIPAIARTVVVVRDDSLLRVRLGYQVVVVAGTWLWAVALALLVGGVLVSTRRSRATIWAAVGAGVGALAIIGALAAGRVVARSGVPAATMPADVLGVFYDTITSALHDLAVGLLLLALVVGAACWSAGPFAPARALRGAYRDLTGAVREHGDARGLSTGRAGRWLYAQRSALRIGIAIVAAAVLVLNRPISTGLVVGTAVTCGVVLALLGFLERPAAQAPTG